MKLRHFSFFLLLITGCQTKPGLEISCAGNASENFYDKAPENFSEALSQRYHYYGCGGQSFAFFSEDGNYVLKLFKQEPFDPPTWLAPFPLLEWYKDKKKEKCAKKKERVLHSFKLALQTLPCETKILYLHFHRTQDLPTNFPFLNRPIDLNTVDFVLQKRGKLACEYLLELREQKNLPKAQEAIDKLFALSYALCQKGVRNRDANFESNCGFVDDEPFLIDTGRLVPSDPAQCTQVFQKEVKKVALPFQAWLDHNFPELSPYFKEAVNTRLKS